PRAPGRVHLVDGRRRVRGDLLDELEDGPDAAVHEARGVAGELIEVRALADQRGAGSSGLAAAVGTGDADGQLIGPRDGVAEGIFRMTDGAAGQRERNDEGREEERAQGTHQPPPWCGL